MGNRNNNRLSPKKIATKKGRVERRKEAINRRVEGQFKDIKPGQQQKIVNNLHRVRRQRF